MNPKSTILIVDDEEMFRMTLEFLLSSLDCQLDFASTGMEALTKAEAWKPDLVLLDVMMPGMDGFEVCRRLRANPVTAEMPVIMVTGLEGRESRLQGIEAGADDFISKPYDPIELKTRVQALTRLNRYRRLQGERAKFEWVTEKAGEGYLLLNPEGEAIYANPQARLYLDLANKSSWENFGKFFDLAKSRYRLEPENAWLDWRSGRSSCYLMHPETQTQTSFWLSLEIFDLASESGHCLIRLQNVSEKMNRQRYLWQFKSHLVHKLITPMVGLLSGLENLAGTDADLTSPEARQWFQIALEGARQLNNRMQNILQYFSAPVRACDGKGFDMAAFPDLLDEIGDARRFLKPKISISEQAARQRIALSSFALELVVMEIFENAWKFHPRKSPAIEVSIKVNDKNVVEIRIADDGRHLSPQALQNLCSPFRQGEKDFTGEVPGMGLGLSMISAVLWSAGGSCRFLNRGDRPGLVVEVAIPTLN